MALIIWPAVLPVSPGFPVARQDNGKRGRGKALPHCPAGDFVRRGPEVIPNRSLGKDYANIR
jgi:hypothetical protein